MREARNLRAFVHGRVQGVSYRDFVCREARSLELHGYVRNLPDGETVEVVAEGERKKLEVLLKRLEGGPRRTRVERVEYEWYEPLGHFTEFGIADY